MQPQGNAARAHSERVLGIRDMKSTRLAPVIAKPESLRGPGYVLPSLRRGRNPCHFNTMLDGTHKCDTALIVEF